MEFMNDISFTGLCSQSTNAAGRSSNALRGAPSDSDVAHFRESLGERSDERAPAGAKEGAKEGAEAKDSKDERVSSIEGLFKGFSGLPGAAAGVSAASAGLGAEAASAAQGTAAPDAAAQLSAERLEGLVSRILVNSPEKGASEVRITLGDNILKGAEISITRDHSGSLSVRISTTDPSVFQTLVASQGDLQRGLESGERRPVAVEMNREDARGDAQGDDSRRRSRGLDEMAAYR